MALSEMIGEGHSIYTKSFSYKQTLMYIAASSLIAGGAWYRAGNEASCVPLHISPVHSIQSQRAMTLIVSLAVPDGIVMAADSLVTLSGAVSCGACTKQAAIVPMTTMTVQKIYPFVGRFGISTQGRECINSRSILDILESLELNLSEQEAKSLTVSDAAQRIKDTLAQEIQNEDPGFDVHGTEFVVGFHMCGYDGSTPKAYNVHIADRKLSMIDLAAWRWSVLCDGDDDGAIWHDILERHFVLPTTPKSGLGQNDIPPVASFSRDTAVNYAKFLIRTTSQFQSFTLKMPSIGGDMQIALITEHEGFQWIEKPAGAKQI